MSYWLMGLAMGLMLLAFPPAPATADAGEQTAASPYLFGNWGGTRQRLAELGSDGCLAYV